MTLKALNYNKTPAANNSDPPVGAPENNDPDTVNNIQREMMAAIAELTEQVLPRKTTGGSGAAYTVNIGPVGLAPQNNYFYALKFHTANHANPTLRINSQATKSLQGAYGEALPAGAIEANSAHIVWYNGAQFRVITLPEYHEIRRVVSGRLYKAIIDSNGRFAIFDGNDEVFRVTTSGDIHVDGDIHGYSTSISSDERDKYHIVKLDPKYMSSLVSYINPIQYCAKINRKEYFGFSAQNVQETEPVLVGKYMHHKLGEERLKINTSSLLAVLWGAVQDLQNRVMELEKPRD